MDNNKTLLDELNQIQSPRLKKLRYGIAYSVKQFWDEIISQYNPDPEIMLKWHDVLVTYVNSEHPVFAIRGYNSMPPNKYDDLRRGFLTLTDDFDFFYTDNFFAAYFCKMAIDGFVPSFNELQQTFALRKFPSRFGNNTAEERELMAIKQGRDPLINSSGFKVAHIIPVGMGYDFNGVQLGAKAILETYFPKGERSDWKMICQEDEYFFARKMLLNDNARKYAAAHFLRFIHPFNYFLCPKKTCERNNMCKDVSEYSPLLDYVHDINLETFGDKYLEFLNLVMADEKYYSPLFKASCNSINIEYGRELPKNVQHEDEKARQNVNCIGNTKDMVHKLMAYEYLTDPQTSFRKLERKYLGIDSQTRGGGFIAKKIINAMGIKAEFKGKFKELRDVETPQKALEEILAELNKD